MGNRVELPLNIESLEGMTVRAGECDGELFVDLHQEKRHWYYPLGSASIHFGPQPFALKVEGGQAVFRNTRVYRDIVWLGARRRDTAWSMDRKLADHEIFVLGDNVPVSDDSRFDLGPVDARKALKGKVLRVLAN